MVSLSVISSTFVTWVESCPFSTIYLFPSSAVHLWHRACTGPWFVLGSNPGLSFLTCTVASSLATGSSFGLLPDAPGPLCASLPSGSRGAPGPACVSTAPGPGGHASSRFAYWKAILETKIWAFAFIGSRTSHLSLKQCHCFLGLPVGRAGGVCLHNMPAPPSTHTGRLLVKPGYARRRLWF